MSCVLTQCIEPPHFTFIDLSIKLRDFKVSFGFGRYKIPISDQLWVLNNCIWDSNDQTFREALVVTRYLKTGERFDAPLEGQKSSSYLNQTHTMVLNIRTVYKSCTNLELLKADDEPLLLSTEKFECPICFDIFQPGEGIVLHECLHTHCR